MTANDVYERLARRHIEDLEDPRYSAEGLDGAACSPKVKRLVQYAIAAAEQGVDAQTWRASIVAEAGADATPLVAEAERCMRASGVWPWPGGESA